MVDEKLLPSLPLIEVDDEVAYDDMGASCVDESTVAAKECVSEGLDSVVGDAYARLPLRLAPPIAADEDASPRYPARLLTCCGLPDPGLLLLLLAVLPVLLLMAPAGRRPWLWPWL